MLHMTIAANVLNAIGGAPFIDSPTFIPDFPLRLPLTNVTVDIEPLSAKALHNFMLIESTTYLDKSIGAAYVEVNRSPPFCCASVRVASLARSALQSRDERARLS
jgi:hypothetical protein